MPTLSVLIPAYDAADHLGRALAGLETVPGVEVVIVDDGSRDETGRIADAWAARHPQLARVIHQRNLGHGGAVNTGIAAARGRFVKVLDADDRLDPAALATVVAALATADGDELDAVFTDFVHERAGKPSRVARFDSVFPTDRVFSWEHTERFVRRQVLMMHAITYRTELVRRSGLRLPEHTFYVDNLYVMIPLAHVRRMRYLPVPLYRYAVGRPGQSVDADVMLARVDQQVRVNRLALAALPDAAAVARGEVPVRLQQALLHHLEGVCAVTSATLARGASPAHLVQRARFWADVRAESPWLYARLRRTLLGTVSNLPGAAGRHATRLAYRVARRVVGFS